MVGDVVSDNADVTLPPGSLGSGLVLRERELPQPVRESDSDPGDLTPNSSASATSQQDRGKLFSAATAAAKTLCAKLVGLLCQCYY